MASELSAKKEIREVLDPERKQREVKRTALESEMVSPRSKEQQASPETARRTETGGNPEGLSLRELTGGERQRLRDIGMSSANIDKCKVDKYGVFHLDCRNSDLEGKRHPMTGVPFERKRITVNGVRIEGVFPQFSSVTEFRLPENLRYGSESEQFRYLNAQLREQIGKDPWLRGKFSEQQIQMIESGRNPAGYTWHHNESCGRMQLVETSKHAATGHTGGDSIWCGR